MERPADEEPRKIPEGVYLGTLRWYAADGTVRSWVVTQGKRANSIGVVAKVLGSDLVRRFGGFDWFLKCLRKRLAAPRRQF